MKRLLTIVSLYIFTLLPVGAAGANAPAQQLVIDTTTRLLALIESEREKITARPVYIYELVEGTISPHFDFERMGRLVLGKHWRKASKTQREQFVKEFSFLLVRTYATAMMDYTGQEVIYLPYREGKKKGEVVVRTEIDQKGGFPIPIDYNLHLKDGAWKVYNVKIDAVSLVLNYRTTFSGEIRKLKGIDGLIAQLQKRNQDARDGQ
ncbi:MAG: ABC transporter substrate-binding protein [Gammaproteobacteria bacterium]|nr:ABC transporter substrate-binding protein [Gammaproteobacteria bacterium]